MNVPLKNMWNGQIHWQNIDYLFHWDNGVVIFKYGKYEPNAPVKDGKCPSCKYNKRNFNACRQCKLFDRTRRQSNYIFDSTKSARFNEFWKKVK